MRLSIPQVAAREGFSESAVRVWVNRGLLPALRLPGRGKRPMIRIEEKDLEAFLVHYRKDVIRNSKLRAV